MLTDHHNLDEELSAREILLHRRCSTLNLSRATLPTLVQVLDSRANYSPTLALMFLGTY